MGLGEVAKADPSGTPSTEGRRCSESTRVAATHRSFVPEEFQDIDVVNFA